MLEKGYSKFLFRLLLDISALLKLLIKDIVFAINNVALINDKNQFNIKGYSLADKKKEGFITPLHYTGQFAKFPFIGGVIMAIPGCYQPLLL